VDENSLSAPETQPLPGIPNDFEGLPLGALIGNRRYAVIEIRATSPSQNTYLVESLNPIRRCPQCGVYANDHEQSFCEECGADLSQVHHLHLRYLADEQKEDGFATESQLTAACLRHPNLFLPNEIFSEVPYGSLSRMYRIRPEFSPTPITELDIPQELNIVLKWGDQLAKALIHLHQHQVVLRQVDVESVGVVNEEAQWVNLDRVEVLSPQLRDEAEGVKRQNIRELARLLLYLASGKKELFKASNLPPSAYRLFEQAMDDQDMLMTATDFEAELDAAFREIRSPQSLVLLSGQRTDVGQVRSLNEDSLLTLEMAPVFRSKNQHIGLYLVADGMGGHAAGDVASQLTSRVIGQLASEEIFSVMAAGEILPDFALWLTQAAQKANQSVYQRRRLDDNDMGCTLVMAIVQEDSATIANVGDSRCYHLHSEGLSQITTDHSLVERLVAAGQITREEALVHPQKNVIYRVIGDKRELEVDIYTQKLVKGESLLFCSDGLSGEVSDENIWQIWQTSISPQDACDRLAEAANQAGGNDNVTVVIVQVTT